MSDKLNYIFRKTIRLNQSQLQNWNNDKVRHFLNNRKTLSDRILHNKADNFEFLKKLFERGAVKIIISKVTKEELERLEKL